MGELERIRARYVERDHSVKLSGFWTLTNPVVVHLMQERERAVLRGMARLNIDLNDVCLLDVGCGGGQEFSNYLRWGGCADRMYGVDLSESRLQVAMARGVGNVSIASGSALPFDSNTFDLVIQNVVFSSVVDDDMRKAIATEMLRVVKPGGWLLWYDAAWSSTRDPHFRSVKQAEVEGLFPGVCWDWQHLTTHLGLLNRINRLFGERALGIFDALRIFKTHRLGWGRCP